MFEIPLIKPYLNKAIKARVLSVLESGHLTEGAVTAEFEKAVADYLGVRYCIAVTSCTVGLDVALRSCNIGVGDEVIVPAFTYPATAHVVRLNGATPVFTDVDRDTMLIDYDHMGAAITKRTKAIMPVSLFGNPLDRNRLNSFKKKHGLIIIEDAACALGASHRGVATGKAADLSVFSLHPRKFITTGEGGLITTDNARLAKWIKSYKRFGMGMGKKRVVFEDVGTNCKLSDLQSAVGLMQMKQFQKLFDRRRKQAAYYTDLLKDCPGVTLPATTPRGRHSYQSYCIYVEKRDLVLKRMRTMGIEAQIGSYFLPGQPVYRADTMSRIAGELTASRWVDQHCLCLPLYHQMTKKIQQKVVSTLAASIAAIR